MASAIGGLTSRVVRTFDRLGGSVACASVRECPPRRLPRACRRRHSSAAVCPRPKRLIDARQDEDERKYRRSGQNSSSPFVPEIQSQSSNCCRKADQQQHSRARRSRRVSDKKQSRPHDRKQRGRPSTRYPANEHRCKTDSSLEVRGRGGDFSEGSAFLAWASVRECHPKVATVTSARADTSRPDDRTRCDAEMILFSRPG